MSFPAEIISEDFPAEDRRNIIDHFKGMENEEIIEELNGQRNDFGVLFENFAYDFNIATGIRNANAFAAKEITIVGRKKWDKRGAVGTYNYENIVQFGLGIDNLMQAEHHILKQGFTPVVIDNIDGAVDMTTYKWPDKPYMIFGQEDIGVSTFWRDDGLCYDYVEIPQQGSTRSLNVGCASAIAMYDWIIKKG